MFAEKLSTEHDALIYASSDFTMRIDPWGKNSLRVRITPKGGGQTSDWALDIPPEKTRSIIEISYDNASIRNGKLLMELRDTRWQHGFFSVYKIENGKKTLLFAEHDYMTYAHNPGTHTFRPAKYGLFHCELHIEAYDDEMFFGMGQNETGSLNLKGCVLDLYQRHTKAPVPFVVSSRGYGMLWNNPSLGRVEFGKNLTRWVSYGCKQMDFYITTGDSYAEILKNYVNATGHAPKFPYWASGFWQCKLRYKTQEELLSVAREYKKRGLPLSVIVIDFYHWKEFGDWKLDPEAWPDPVAMVKELEEMGVRLMISPWTLVSPKSGNFEHMKKHCFFTGSVDNNHDSVYEFGEELYQYDPTNPQAAKYLWTKWKENYFDLGIRTFWLDPCDEYHPIADYDKVMYHIGPALEAHSCFPVCHQKNIYEGLLSAGEDEVVTICRNMWAGSQRYGACPAPHDIVSSFKHLKEYVKVGLNVMMSGIPWWNCDIGGFLTDDNTSPVFTELMIRWYQYGMFLPVFRTHGNRPNNEAWNLGGDSYKHIRRCMLLRERLRPYLMKQMDLASEKGTPPMRPLFFDFSEDSETYRVEDEFLFGPDILVAPVTDYGLREKEVYLPSGCDWICAWTGEEYPGGQTYMEKAPIDYIPVFIRRESAYLRELFAAES